MVIARKTEINFPVNNGTPHRKDEGRGTFTKGWAETQAHRAFRLLVQFSVVCCLR
jgi:hypothetical protein